MSRIETRLWSDSRGCLVMSRMAENGKQSQTWKRRGTGGALLFYSLLQTDRVRPAQLPTPSIVDGRVS